MNRPTPQPEAPTRDLLVRFTGGDAEAWEALAQRLGDELRKLARHHVAPDKGPQSLTPTGLVNEAWIRIGEREGLDFEHRSAFFAFVSKVMRSVLVDRARAAAAEKRGGRRHRVSLATGFACEDENAVDLLDLDDALAKLGELDAIGARLVELRFFGGLSHEEIAEALEISQRTVERRWRFARAWLHGALEE